ncbi:MAG TPA: RNA methyltransferase [Ignavibacteria bacterium]|nr:RNA methyltransferase [Ignavibacteria bacterium]
MTNNEIKNILKLSQKKFRDSENKFVIEGRHLIDECLKSPVYKKQFDRIYISKSFQDDNLLKRLYAGKYSVELVSDDVIKKISDTSAPQGILAVVNKFHSDVSAESSDIIVCLDTINDPGNLGTIIRTLWWFGIKDLYLSENSSDAYNPKCVRATQGGIFNIQIRENLNLKASLSELNNSGYEIILLRLDTDNRIFDFNPIQNARYCFVFGNEANGISAELKNNREFKSLKIPSNSKCESLNVASSVSAVCYHIRYALWQAALHV